MYNFEFILASASPRRKELLTKAGYEFDVIPSGIDESIFTNNDPIEYAKALAAAKAEKIAKLYPQKFIIGADTIAESNGLIIGKAENAEQAEKIVRLLFTKPHRAITGIAIININNSIRIIDADITTVYPKPMTEQQIKQHIAGNSWQDKAGAYAIQETGDEFVEKIQGSLTNVMGLPMEMFEKYINILKTTLKCST